MFALEQGKNRTTRYGVDDYDIQKCATALHQGVRYRNLPLGTTLEHVKARHLGYLSGLAVLVRKQVQNFNWKLKGLFAFNSIPFCRSPSVIELKKCLIFLNDLFHDWSSLSHKLLQLECLILILFLPLIGIFASIVIAHHIIRGLVEFVLLPKVVCLNLLLNTVVCCANNCSLDRPRLQSIEVLILACFWHHFEDIEVLLLTQLYQVSKLLRSPLLSICSSVVYPLTYH